MSIAIDIDYDRLAELISARILPMLKPREPVTISLAELVTETGLGERTLRRRLESPGAPKRLEGKLCVYNRAEALKWAGKAKV